MSEITASLDNCCPFSAKHKSRTGTTQDFARGRCRLRFICTYRTDVDCSPHCDRSENSEVRKIVHMPTRRRFFRSAAALSAALPLAAEPATALPPSLAALKSMRGQVRPITNAEREKRLERARQLMRENKIDALFLAGGTSLNGSGTVGLFNVTNGSTANILSWSVISR